MQSTAVPQAEKETIQTSLTENQKDSTTTNNFVLVSEGLNLGILS